MDKALEEIKKLLKAWNEGEFSDIKAAKRERLGGPKRPAEPSANASAAKAKAKTKPTAKAETKPKAKAETKKKAEAKPPKNKAKASAKAELASTQAEKPSLMSDSDLEAGMDSGTDDSDNVPDMCDDPVRLSGFEPEPEHVD